MIVMPPRRQYAVSVLLSGPHGRRPHDATALTLPYLARKSRIAAWGGLGSSVPPEAPHSRS
jgi:hypothetical protein